MEEVTPRSTVEYIPSLPTKAKQKQTTLTQITSDDIRLNSNRFSTDRSNAANTGSMHSLVLNSKTPSTTVIIAANQPDRPTTTPSTDATNGPHVVTIKINTETNKTPKISSVHLKSDVDLETFKSIVKKNNTLVRINVDENRPRIIENEEILKNDQPPYINCNAFLNSMNNVVMSSGQCSPSDTLDSGTCSDLDGTPPPLPKKKTTKSTKAVSVTLIGSSKSSEVDFEDNDSNISCDSLNYSELNGSVHTDESHCDDLSKKAKKRTPEPPAPPRMPYVTNGSIDSSFLPLGLLQDIRDRSTKLSPIETESDSKPDKQRPVSQNSDVNANGIKESPQLTSFLLVAQLNKEKANDEETPNKTSLISESTYEERKTQPKVKEQMCYSSNYFDADKYYDFHLNEKQFDDVSVVSEKSAKSGDGDDDNDTEYFAGVKDYISEGPPSTIRSSKGTIRGVKNRVRAGIATFLQIQNTTKSYREKDAGKVVVYTTTMGIVRSTYQRCLLVKKILRNLLIKFEERDIFMSTEYQDEIRERMKSDQILVPQLYIDGHHIGDAETVEKLNESGELRKMLKPYKSPDACTTCQMCGGFRLLPCRICNGSKKSLHRNHFTAEFVALKCMNCDEVGLVRCEACS